jgi:hypothetical protein
VPSWAQLSWTYFAFAVFLLHSALPSKQVCSLTLCARGCTRRLGASLYRNVGRALLLCGEWVASCWAAPERVGGYNDTRRREARRRLIHQTILEAILRHPDSCARWNRHFAIRVDSFLCTPHFHDSPLQLTPRCSVCVCRIVCANPSNLRACSTPFCSSDTTRLL